MDDTTTETARARAAFEQRAWTRAHQLLSDVVAHGDATAEDHEHLAVAAYLLGRDEAAEAALRDAYRAFLDDGADADAARCAFWLGMLLVHRGEDARGRGWLARAERTIADHATCAAHGLLLVPAGLVALDAGDAEGAREAFRQAGEIGDVVHDADLQALARLGLGQCHVVLGDVDVGLALLDEVMVAVRGAEVSPIPAGIAYCAVIEVCREVLDLPRARAWTAALGAQPDLVPYRGQCLVHVSQVLQLEGDWTGALAEAARARRHLSDPLRPEAGMAAYQAAELHRLRGDVEAAEADYAEAARFGHPVQPGHARLRVAQGDAVAAAASLRRALAEDPPPGRTVELLAALAEALLADGDLEGARSAADRLAPLVSALDVPTLHAVDDHVHGAVALAEGDVPSALVALRRAWETWARLGAPYEAARVRVLLGVACRHMGDADGAALELDAARSAFEELGAQPDLHRLEALAGAPGAPPGGLTEREVEVLGHVARGATNRAIAETLVISEHTVARHVQNILGKLDVESRTAAAAYAFEHHLVPPRGG
jgi:ATP/maltotriose-dependent transcriptional regulator MalT